MVVRNFLSYRSRALFVLFLLTVFSLGVFLPVAEAVGVNPTINFHGKVVNLSDGTNVTDNDYSFTFELYSTASGGSPLWTENQTLTVNDGIFRAVLGSVTTFASADVDFNNDSLYLEITFDGETAGTRIRFSSVPYAMNAQKVNGLTVTNTSDNPFSSETILKIGDGKTVVFNNGLTFSGTDGTTITFPNANDTVVMQDVAQTLTNKTIGSTGLTFSGASTDVTTGTDESFTLLPNGTGDIILSQDHDSAVLIGSTANTPAALSVRGGMGSNAVAIFDQLNSGDILAASSSGVTRFAVTNAGGIKLGTDEGDNGECLKSGGLGFTAIWDICSTDAGSNWRLTTANGTLSPNNNTLDFLLGGTATTSAKFGVLNMNGSGPATATVSGDMIVMPRNGANGNIGIGTIAPVAKLDIRSSGVSDLVRIGYDASNYFTGQVSSVGAVTFNAFGASAGFTFTDPMTLGVAGSSNGSLTFQSAGGGIGSASISMDNSGNLTIAVTQAGAAVVLGDGTGDISFEPGSDNVVFNLASTGDLLIQDNGLTYAIFNDSGNVGLGTTTPNSRLDVIGNVSFSGTATASALAIGYNGIGAGTGNGIISGNVGIGTTDVSAYDLSVVGTINTSTAFYINGTQGHTSTNMNCVNVSGGIVTAAGTCAAADSSNWDLVAGALRPKQATTADLLIGGTSTASAKFAVLNMSNGGTPVASVSATTGVRHGISFAGDGSIQSLRMGTLTLGGNTTGNIIFKPGASTTETLTLLGNGNVGIGTTAPLGRLHIDGKATGKALAIFNETGDQHILAASSSGTTRMVLTNPGNLGIGSTNPGALLGLDYTSQAGGHLFIASKSGSTQFILRNNGNVGIGEAGDFARLNVHTYAGLDNDITDVLDLQHGSFSGSPASGIGSGIMFRTMASNLAYSQAGRIAAVAIDPTAGSFTSALTFYVKNSSDAQILEKMRLNQAGNLGIGTTNVRAKLDVNGNLSVAGTATSSALAVGYNGIGAGTNNAIIAGNIGIGTTAPTTGKMVISDGGAALTIDAAVLSATTGTQTTGVDGLQIDFANAGSGAQTNSGLTINVTSNNTNASSILYGLNIGNLSSGGENASEIGLRIGTGWDQGIVIENGNNDGTGFVYSNGGRPTKTITLTPEYAGAVLTASGSAQTTGTMTSDASPSASFRNYYEWTSAETSLQDYTVAVRVTLPRDFSAWTTSNALQVSYNTELTTNDSNKVDVIVYNDADATTTPVGMRTLNTSATVKTWTTVTIDDSELDAGNARDLDAAGETAVIYLKLYSKNNNHVQIGDITLSYLARF